jgi:hypothetical protein
MKIGNPDSVYVDTISDDKNPIYAVHLNAERLYVLTDSRALSPDREYVERLADKVRATGEFNPELWTFASRTDSEREQHYADMYEWEEIEKLAGRW